MNDYVTKWIADLRSGQYGQCKWRLAGGKDSDGKDCYDALGVLLTQFPGCKCNGWDFVFVGEMFVFQPPEFVIKMVGIEWDVVSELISMNDDGVSFEAISIYLETRYETKSYGY